MTKAPQSWLSQLVSASERLCRNHSGSRPANPTPERPPQAPTPPEVESDEDAQLPATGHLGEGVLENDQKQPQVCMARDEGFYPIEDRFCPLVGGGEEGWCVKPPQQGLSGRRAKG